MGGRSPPPLACHIRQSRLTTSSHDCPSCVWRQPLSPEPGKSLSDNLLDPEEKPLRDYRPAIALKSGTTQATPWAAPEVRFAKANRVAQAAMVSEQSNRLAVQYPFGQGPPQTHCPTFYPPSGQKVHSSETVHIVAAKVRQVKYSLATAEDRVLSRAPWGPFTQSGGRPSSAPCPLPCTLDLPWCRYPLPLGSEC